MTPRFTHGIVHPQQTLDPDSALLAELSWMKNLRMSSACEFSPDRNRAIFTRADHRAALHLAIAAPHMLDAAHATVDLQLFRGGLDGELDRCELVRDERGWRVHSCRRIGVF